MTETSPKRIVMTGATGLLGSLLGRNIIDRGDELVVFARNTEKAKAMYPDAHAMYLWAPGIEGAWRQAIDGADAVIHMAGENLDGQRWTDAYKQRLVQSRVESTAMLIEAMEAAKKKPEVFISTSAIGYYGDRGDEVVTEDSDPGSDFLADLCIQWEDAAHPAEDLGVRTVIFRIGLVLAENGGLLEPLKPVFKIGLGGWLGSGKQWMSWIHRSDIAGAYLHALDDDTMSGVYNACTPTPVRNKEFCKILGEAMNRPVLFPVPGFIPKLLKGEFGAVATEGQRVSSSRLEQTGYNYSYTDLKSAFEAVL